MFNSPFYTLHTCPDTSPDIGGDRKPPWREFFVLRIESHGGMNFNIIASKRTLFARMGAGILADSARHTAFGHASANLNISSNVSLITPSWYFISSNLGSRWAMMSSTTRNERAGRTHDFICEDFTVE